MDFLIEACDIIMMSPVPNLGYVTPILARSFTYMPTFMVQLLREVGFLIKACDIIMMSPVPNLGYVTPILARSFTPMPIFMVQLLQEVGFLNEAYMVFYYSKLIWTALTLVTGVWL